MKGHAFRRSARVGVLGRLLLVLLLTSVCWQALGARYKNRPPSVQLTSPANGTGLVAPAAVDLEAVASDSDGTISRVDFYQGSTLIGSATSAPYRATWSNVPAGNYSLTAKATDNGGAAATSAPVSITVSSQTALVVSSPADGASFHVRTPLTVTGTFEGPSESTVLVDSEQSTVLASVSGNTYSATFEPDQHGTVGASTITVRLARPDGTSASRTVTFNGHDSPVIAFTGPSCDTLTAPAAVLLSADAKVPGGSVEKVQFLQGSTLLASLTKPPYQLNWTNVPVGTHTLTARATSNFGTTASTSIQIKVTGPNTPPSITMTSPAADASFTSPASIPLTVSVSDPDPGGSVRTVEYFANGNLIAASSVAPFNVTWPNVLAGAYTLTARATDDRDAQATSPPVSISVVAANQAPAVALTLPPQGATFTAPATIALAAAASDVDGSIDKVEFYQGSVLLGTATAVPYAISWANVPAGDYTLSARAIDNLGAGTTSAEVGITVSPSPINVTSPANGTSIAGNSTLVRGTFIGPANTGITVNGVIAVTDQDNHFYAHDVPLEAGTNTLTVRLANLAGEAAAQSINVSSNGTTPLVKISAAPVSGVAPLKTKFTISNASAAGVNVQLNGATVADVPAGEERVFDITINAPAVFPATITANGAAASASKDFVLVAKDGGSVDQMFQGIWAGMSSQLAQSDLTQGLLYFDPDVRSFYQGVLGNVSEFLPGMFGTPPSIHPTSLRGEDDVEYLTVVRRNGTNYGHFIYFSRGADGVWRLSSL